MKDIYFMQKSLQEPEIVTDEDIAQGLLSRVVLYNDEVHSFEEVIRQIMKAVRCSFEEARGMTFEVHVKGKAIVYTGEMSQCLKVSSVLEEIALHTQIIT